MKNPQGSGHDRNSYDDYETIYLAWLIWTWFVYMVTICDYEIWYDDLLTC